MVAIPFLPIMKLVTRVTSPQPGTVIIFWDVHCVLLVFSGGEMGHRFWSPENSTDRFPFQDSGHHREGLKSEAQEDTQTTDIGDIRGKWQGNITGRGTWRDFIG